MATRVTPDLDSTRDILEKILPPLIRDERVAFVCPSGQAELILTRIRVMISRNRKSLRAKNRKPRKFRLLSSVHPETHGGIRMDCIVLSREVSFAHELEEQLEDLLSVG